MINKPQTLFWYRIGDSDDYHKTKALSHFVSNLCCKDRLLVGIHQMSRAVSGFTTPSFRGNNYVSIYAGNNEGEMVRPISAQELITISRHIRRWCEHVPDRTGKRPKRMFPMRWKSDGCVMEEVTQ